MDARNTTPPAHVHDQLCGCGDASAPSLYDEHDERAAHTPGPWTISSDPLEIADAHNYFAASVRGERPTDRDAANAAFIVTACNSHEDLLRELKVAVDALSALGDD